MVLIEVHHGGLCAWTVLDRGIHTGGELCRMHLPAATDGLHGVVLCHLKLQYRQVKDLACFANKRKRQTALTGLALFWHAMNNDLVGLRSFAQCASRVSLLAAC
jgi:hypothetical protein